MGEEFNINAAVAEFVNQNIESFYNTGKGLFKDTADKIRLHLSDSYKDYLACVCGRYSKAKSFFIRDEPTFLYNFYVPMGISSASSYFDKASIKDIASVNNNAVITGSGGSGKSMLMRHLFLDAIFSKSKVPIFLELRELNQAEQSLRGFIKELV